MASAPQPTLDSLTTINEDGSRNFLHPADVHGRFNLWRRIVGLLLIGLYVALPWIPINGNPAVFLDVVNRQFHLLGLTFVPQDMWLGFFVITGAGFALFYVTAFVGRVWCGWACPQTVFIEQVFRRIERVLEGNAMERRKLDASPWNAHKIARRGTKLLIFALIALAIAHIFISYFVSLPGLYQIIHQAPTANWGLFVIVFGLSAILFFNFAWFREQFCIVLCPYGRLQSALIDDDSIVIGYDRNRGEPRGKLHTPGAGDCVACNRCVQVCPTGIDIRQGLQMECVSCSNCIDACDEVMTRIGRPKGLIRYDSMNALAGKKTHWIRPRTILYTVLLLFGATALAFSLSTLRSVQVSALRMPGQPYYLADGNVRNQYVLRVANKLNKPRHFEVIVRSAQPAMTTSGSEGGLDIDALGEQQRPLIVLVPQARFSGPFPVEISIQHEGKTVMEKTVPFIGPAVTEPPK